MASILKDMGITEYEPRVLNQMLEFSYRYISCILDDAQIFSSHAKKKSLDVDDVRLAIQMQMDRHFTTPPPRELLLEIARQKNSIALPLIKSTAGLRLPPDRYSLTACNYRLKSANKKPRPTANAPRISITALQPNNTAKVTPAINLNSKSGATLSVVTKAVAPPTVTIVSRTTASAVPRAAPTPIIKFSDGTGNRTFAPTTAATTPQTTTTDSVAMPLVVTSSNTTTMISDVLSNSENSNKRKREDDGDDYDVE